MCTATFLEEDDSDEPVLRTSRATETSWVMYDEEDDVKWSDLVEGYPAWSSNIGTPMKSKTGPELLKWMNEQWEYECTHPRNPDRWIMSRKEYDWWVEYLRMAEEERRIAFASRATQLL